MWLYGYSCVFILTICHHPVRSGLLPFDSIVAFGDSHTDSGNVYHLTSHRWPIVPPYFQGRFSNGIVWIEALGLSNLKNYAYGGATSNNNFINGYTAMNTLLVPGFRQQIDIYINGTNTTTVNFERTLYAIWIGVNDYYANMTIAPSAVVDSILKGVRVLRNFGAKHILMMNQPPAQKLPTVNESAHALYTFYEMLTIYHNNNLSYGIQNITNTDKQARIHLFDLYSLLLTYINNNKNSSTINVKNNCWTVGNWNVTILCTNPDSYVYIDEYHYTNRIHKMIADSVREYLSTSSGLAASLGSIRVLFCLQLIAYSMHGSYS